MSNKTKYYAYHNSKVNRMLNELKDYTTMAFDEAIELNPEEFYKWCKANPCNKVANKYLIKEIKGELDEND